ncbi:MAG: 16S rRNA (guanine(527)-N(7))-methyltransferase RsmG [Bradymonadia bacterium]
MTLEAAQRMLHGAGIDLALTAVQYETIHHFLKLRSAWNKTHNLTGPAADKDPWNLDVCDAAALNQIFRPGLRLYDVGSGSGVPGLIFAILRSDVEVHLVEPLTKRVAFLKTVRTKLNLKNIKVYRERWPIEGDEPCQVVSRAVVPPEDWPSLANSDNSVRAIYRYLARQRSPFNQPDFELDGALDYRRSAGESLRIERWQRTK